MVVSLRFFQQAGRTFFKEKEYSPKLCPRDGICYCVWTASVVNSKVLNNKEDREFYDTIHNFQAKHDHSEKNLFRDNHPLQPSMRQMHKANQEQRNH